MARLMKMYERALAARALTRRDSLDAPAPGGLDFSLPNGDRENRQDDTEEELDVRELAVPANGPDATELVRLTCDSCAKPFDCKINPADKPAAFDPATAAALCDRCGNLMVRLQERRRKDPFAYLRFKQRVAESVARKYGLIPKAN